MSEANAEQDAAVTEMRNAGYSVNPVIDTMAGAAKQTGGQMQSALWTLLDNTRRGALDFAEAGLGPTEAVQELNQQYSSPEAEAKMDERYAAADKKINEGEQEIARVKNGRSAATQFLVDLGVGGIQLAGDMALGAINPALATAALATRTFGGGAHEAREAGADDFDVVLTGIASAGKEVILNKLLGGLGKVYGKSKLAGVVDKVWDKIAKNPKVAGVLKAVFNTEGAEEMLSGLIDPAIRAIYSDKGLGEYSELELSELLYQGLVGQVLGAGATGVEVATNLAKNGNLDTQMPKGEKSPQKASDTQGDTQIPPSTAETPTNAPDALNSTEQPQQNTNAADILADVAMGNKNTAPQQGADSTAVNTDPRQHTPVEQAVIDEYQSAVDDNLVNYIETVRDNPNAKIGRYSFKPVSEKAAAKIKELTGIDTAGNKTVIEPRMVGHILKDHGPNGETDHSMKDVNDIARIQYVIDNYDNIEHGGTSSAYVTNKPNGKHGNAQTVVFTKAVNGTYYVVEAVPDTAKKTVFVVSAYMQKKAAGTPSVNAEASRVTSENAAVQPAVYKAEAFTPYIAQSGANVNARSKSGQGAERVRGYEQNIASSTITDPELKARIEQDLQTYRQLGNNDTLKKAYDIMLKGLPTAQAELQQALGKAKNGAKLPPEMVPLSRLVANELTRNGDVAAARQMLADVAVELTAAGQLGQAGRILRTADPATALDTIRKALNEINNKFSQRMPNSQWQAELTEAEEQLIANTDFTEDGAFERVYEQIAKRLGAEMPVSKWEQLTELRRINMLLRPRSLIKNVAGNLPMKVLRKGAERLSAEIQKALPAEQRTRGVADSNQKLLAREYFAEHGAEILETGDKWDINSLVRKYKTVFKDGKITAKLSELSGKELHNVLEGMRQLTYNALKSGDAPFMRSAFVDSLSQYMAAQGINSADGITQDAIDFAMANAMEATFQNANVVATALNSIKRNADPAVAMALDVLLPFTTTPTNIFSQIVKYSPAGLVNSMSGIVKQGATASNIDALSKGIVGSAVLALGWGLRSLGLITGGEDEDKDKAALDKATGNNIYSIAGKISYDWAQPVGSLLALGAEISDAISEQESWASAVANAFYTAGDSLLNMSLFQNVMSVLKGSGKPTQQIIDAIIEGGATQLIPGLAGDIAKLIDGTVRSTYTGGNVFDDAKAKMRANTPFASTKLPASINVKGEANTRGGLGERAINTLLNPATMAQGERTAVDDEIYRILEETGSKTHFPSVSPYSVEFDGETFKMNGKEREQFQTTQGQAYYDVAADLIKNAAYKKASPIVQRDILEDVRAYALALAKDEFLAGKGKKYEWPSKAAETTSRLSDPAKFLAETAIAKANAERKGETFSTNGRDALAYYATKGFNNRDMDKLADDMLGEKQGKAYDAFRAAKASPKETMELFTQMDGEKQDGKYNQADVFSVLIARPNMTDEQKAAIWANTQTGKDDWATYLAKHR